MARIAAAARYLLLSQAPRVVSPLFTHTRFLPVASIRWCHLNMLSDSHLSNKASKNPGMDFKHWFVNINIWQALLPKNDFSLEEHVDIYVKTLAKVVGSDEEAMKKIYKVNCDYIEFGSEVWSPGFGCEIDWETTNVLRGMPHVEYITPDFYVDPENKDYGGQFSMINGKLLERSSNRMIDVQLSSPFLDKPWIELLSSKSIPSPWLLLPPPEFGEHNKKAYRFYSIAEGKEFSINRNEEEDEDEEFVGSSHGWLASFNRSNRQLSLSNPLSGHHVKLPSVNQTLGSQQAVGKVIISCSPISEPDSCRAVMIFGPDSQLAFCCPGHSTTQWTPIGCKSSNYSDIVYSHSHKLFFCLTDCGRLESWDLSHPLHPRMVEEHKFDIVANYPMKTVFKIETPRIHQVKHLVMNEQSNEFFVVMRKIWKHESGWGYYVDSPDPIYPHATHAIQVYKILKDRKACIHSPPTMNNLAMFIGANHSFAMEASSEYPEFNAGCIFFTDEKRLIPPNWVTLPFGAPDFGVYNYSEEYFFSNKDRQEIRKHLRGNKYSYVYDVRIMKRLPPLPMWFTPTLH